METPENWKGFSNNYNCQVFSLTKFPKRRKQVLKKVKTGKVLNMGCGPTPFLNYDLIMSGNHVTATDFCNDMLKISRSKFNNPNLEFRLEDSRDYSFASRTFDTVISVNSILPEERGDADKMFNEAYRVLKKRGMFIAFLVSFDSCIKINKNLNPKLRMDHENQRVWDTTGWQCYHTPETIEENMKKAGFQKYGYEKVFLKTKWEIDEFIRLYNMDTRKSLVYEYLLTAEK